MLVQKPFKRLKINAGFTLSVADGTMAVKISEKEYAQNYLGKQIKFSANKNDLVWVDTAQIKRWYQW